MVFIIEFDANIMFQGITIMKNSCILLILMSLFSFSGFGQKSVHYDSNFVKNQKLSNKVASNERLKIRVGLSTKNINKQILFTVDERATDDYDKGFDAEPFAFLKNDIYWVSGSKKLVIQAVGDLLIDRVLPIGIVTKDSSLLKIKIDTIENPFDNMEVYLRDNDTMETYDIVNGEFEINLGEGEFNDKYAIVFEPKIEIPLEEEVITKEIEEEVITEIERNIEVMEVYVSGFNNDLLKIKKPEEMELTDISIYNLLGQKIIVWNSNLNQNEMELPFRAKKGVHLVVMNTSEGRISKKVIVY